MTRPAGVTPKGLPYPGSADIHPQTPAAIQALAEAIEANLTSMGTTVVDMYHGLITVQSGGTYGSFVIPFPNLASVTGFVAGWGLDDGGASGANGYLTGGAGSGYCVFAPVPSSTAPANVKIPGSITVHAVGWGPKRT